MLVVRLMRLSLDFAAGADFVYCEAAPAVAFAGREIPIDFEVVPARCERGPVGQRSDRLERLSHRRRLHERVSEVGEELLHVFEQGRSQG